MPRTLARTLALMIPRIALALSAAVAMPYASADERCYQYGRHIEKLAGILEVRVFFAQPNYGEDPESDARDVQGVLFLDRPICTLSNAKTDDHGESEQIEITLVPLQSQNLNLYAGRRVVVSGSLFQAISGHHHTPVLMQLSSLRERER